MAKRRNLVCAYCGKVNFQNDKNNLSGKNFCNQACYSKFVRPSEEQIAEKFWAKVARTENLDDCWDWLGPMPKEGYYGRFECSQLSKILGIGEYIFAHKMAYYLATGVLADFSKGEVIRHKVCDRPPCCNPYHLAIGSIQDNSDDKCKKGRQPKGEQIFCSKFTSADVVFIRIVRSDKLCTVKELAEIFNCSQSCITRVANGKTWQHIPHPLGLKDYPNTSVPMESWDFKGNLRVSTKTPIYFK